MSLPDLEQRKVDLSNSIVMHLFELLGEECGHHGEKFSRELAAQVMRQFIGTMVINSLMNPAESAPEGMPQAQKWALVWGNYKLEKRMIEEAVGMAFSDAIQVWNPKATPEVLCNIQTIDDGISEGKTTH